MSMIIKYMNYQSSLICIMINIFPIYFISEVRRYHVSFKVEKIYEDSLDFMPSPSVKIQITFIWGIEANIVGWCRQTFCF